MKIHEVMTTEPVSVEQGGNVSEAKKALAEHGIKHLPVVREGGILAGIVSDRDIKLHQAVSEDPDFHTNAKIADVMVRAPYSITPDTPVSEVANYMYKKKIGSALVVDQSRLVGIFTTMDACRILAKIL